MFSYISLLSYNVSSARLFGRIDIIFAACMMHFNNFYYPLTLNQATPQCQNVFSSFGLWRNTCKQLYFVLNILHYNLSLILESFVVFPQITSLSNTSKTIHFSAGKLWACTITLNTVGQGQVELNQWADWGIIYFGLLLSSVAISSPTSANNSVNNVFITNRNKVCNYKNKMLIIINLQSSFK